MCFKLTHARHDPAHCLAPGLFRSLRKGERKTSKLDVKFTHGGESIHFRGSEPLGAEDLRVLQGLVAMAATSGESGRGITLQPETESEAGKVMRESLHLKDDAVQSDALVAKGSYRQLAQELGYADADSGKRFRLFRDSIERLWTVSVIIERNGRKKGFRILSDYESDTASGQLFVALNPRITEAITGRKHTRIDMREVRALKTDPARLIHQRLCGWIDAGKERKVVTDTMTTYVWPNTCEREAMKKRRQAVKKALAELVGLGWKAQEYAPGKWSIERPAI